ncbi:MAG: hypothetical protein ACLR5J_08865 [Lachnospiraceae bacterium]
MKEEKKFQRKCKICGKDFFSDHCNTLYCPTCRNAKIIKNEHVGERFGKLTVLSDYSLNSLRYARCKCDCGRIKIVNYKSLKAGLTTSCGCARILDVPNLINEYGVEAIKRTGRKNGKDVYLCKCPRCGKEFEVLQNNFWRKKSCGCISPEKSAENMANGWKNVTKRTWGRHTNFYLFLKKTKNNLRDKGVYYNKKVKSGTRLFVLNESVFSWIFFFKGTYCSKKSRKKHLQEIVEKFKEITLTDGGIERVMKNH